MFIFEDKTFWTSVLNTFLMGAMGTVPQLIVALLLAVTLNSAVIRFRRFFPYPVFYADGDFHRGGHAGVFRHFR